MPGRCHASDRYCRPTERRLRGHDRDVSRSSAPPRELAGERQEGGDDPGIELAPGAALELLDCRGERQGAAIGTVARHRVERVHDGEDPRGERYLLTAKTPWVSLPVPALVVEGDDVVDTSERKGM